MTFFHEPVVDQESTIITPVVIQILKALKAAWFYDDGIEIVYTNHTGHQPVIGSSTNSDVNGVRLETSSRIEARVITKLFEDLAFTNNPNAFRGPPIWENPAIPAKLNLARYQTKFELTLKYTAPSKAAVNNWINLYHSRSGMGHAQINVPVSYEVMVPNIIPSVLKAIYTNWDNSNPGTSFETFLDNGFDVPYHIQQAPNNPNSRTLVLTETLENVGVPIPGEQPIASIISGNAWEAELTLEFDLLIPAMFLFKYSPYVAGNWLPDWCVDKSLNRNKVYRRGYANGQQADIIMGYLLDKEQVPLYRKNAYIYPPFDTVDVDTSKYKVNPVLQVRISVDPINPRYIVNLITLAEDLGITLHPDLIEFLRSRGPMAWITGTSMFSIGVARDGVLVTPKYTIDAVGNVISDYDLDVNGNYHLLISVTSDFQSLNNSESEEAFKYGDLFNAAVIYNNPGLNPNLLPLKDEDGYVSRYDALELGKHIPTTYKSPGTAMYTVSTLIVDVK